MFLLRPDDTAVRRVCNGGLGSGPSITDELNVRMDLALGRLDQAKDGFAVHLHSAVQNFLKPTASLISSGTSCS